MKKIMLVLLTVILAGAGCKTAQSTSNQTPNQSPVPMPTLTIFPQPGNPNWSLQAAEFQNQFVVEPQCKGIEFLTSDGVKKRDADFNLVYFFYKDSQWDWLMGYAADPGPKTDKGHGIGGLGEQPKLEDAVRDVCLTVWDDLHRSYPVQVGGTVKN